MTFMLYWDAALALTCVVLALAATKKKAIIDMGQLWTRHVLMTELGARTFVSQGNGERVESIIRYLRLQGYSSSVQVSHVVMFDGEIPTTDDFMALDGPDHGSWWL